MRSWMFRGAAAALSAVSCGAGAQQPASPVQLCRAAIRQAEAGAGLPAHLLGAIARVESGRRDPSTGQAGPWPWTVNAEGKGAYFETKAEAIAHAAQLRARGVRSFDVGCMQINLMHHPDAFPTLEEAFDPAANARYAVTFLQRLRERLGDWEQATAWYHSANPELGGPYRNLVAAALAEEAKLPASTAPTPAPTPPNVAAVSQPAAVGWLPSRPGGMTMFGAASPSATPARSSAVGRGLDSYRAQPVAIVGPRMFAAR